MPTHKRHSASTTVEVSGIENAQTNQITFKMMLRSRSKPPLERIIAFYLDHYFKNKVKKIRGE